MYDKLKALEEQLEQAENERNSLLSKDLWWNERKKDSKDGDDSPYSEDIIRIGREISRIKQSISLIRIPPVWEQIHRSLENMADIFELVRSGKANPALERDFVIRSDAYGRYEREFLGLLSVFDDQLKLEWVRRCAKDLIRIANAGSMKNSKDLLKSIEKKLYNICSFHIVHEEGDADSWKAAQHELKKISGQN